MRFRKDAQLDTSQVEDQRGRGGRMPGGLPVTLGGGGGLIGLVILLAVLFLGGGGLGELGQLEDQTVGPGTASSELQTECRTGEDANQREDCRIVGVVNSVQAYWQKTLRGYEPTKTRFFDGVIQTGCGTASKEVGPFYCPQDGYVYIDLAFFDELQSKLGARGGPLAEAYVLAHEYGHHVQNLTGSCAARIGTPARRAARSASSYRRTATRASGSDTLWTPVSSKTSHGRTCPMHSTLRRQSGTIAFRSAPRVE